MQAPQKAAFSEHSIHVAIHVEGDLHVRIWADGKNQRNIINNK